MGFFMIFLPSFFNSSCFLGKIKQSPYQLEVEKKISKKFNDSADLFGSYGN